MLYLIYCLFNGLVDHDLCELNGCPLDPDGSFILNGLEKYSSLMLKKITQLVLDLYYESWN